jgi:aldehyde oxidoreductase
MPISSPRRALALDGGRRDRVIRACTQAPVMDRDDVARRSWACRPNVCGSSPRRLAAALDRSLTSRCNPSLGLAALASGQPVRMVYSRAKAWHRPPSAIPPGSACGSARRGTAGSPGWSSSGIFNTGAYASWGPTVANRVPVHASGPYRMPVLPRPRPSTPRAVSGVPFVASACPRRRVAQEQLYDMLAEKLGPRPAAVPPSERIASGPAHCHRPGAGRRHRHPACFESAPAALGSAR